MRKRQNATISRLNSASVVNFASDLCRNTIKLKNTMSINAKKCPLTLRLGHLNLAHRNKEDICFTNTSFVDF